MCIRDRSDTEVRIFDGAREIARHRRSYNRQQLVLDPAHQQALLRKMCIRDRL